MQPFLEKIYFNSPVSMQNILVTAYGLKLWNERYGGNHDSYLRQVSDCASLKVNQIEEMQNALFLRTLSHAFEWVPFYKKYSKKMGLSIDDFKSLKDITKLPIIEKEMIRSNPKEFYSTFYVNRKHIVLYTSGSTNTPLSVYCDLDSRRHHYAFWSWLRENYSVYKKKRATFFGKIVVPSKCQKPPFWRFDATGKNLLFSSYHLSDKNLRYYCEKLEEYEPAEIIGYPSSLSTLAEFIMKERKYNIRPLVVFTTAETLSIRQRELLKQAFECEVVNQYGSVEMVLFASECHEQMMHIHPAHGFVEIVKDKPYDSAGEIICTGFINKMMPLIRYRLGDHILMKPSKCKCGLAFPIITEIVGRVEDVIITPEGNRVGRLNTILCGFKWIKEAQFVQNNTDEIQLNFVKDNEVSANEYQRLEYEMRKRIGQRMKVSFTEVSNLPLGSNGKVRRVINNLKNIR